MRHRAGWISTFHLICLLATCAAFGVPTALAVPIAAYVTPDLKTPIFGGDVTLAASERQKAATVLAGIVRNALDLSQAEGSAKAARLLGIALRLDPENKAAIVVNGYLTDGQRPNPEASWNADEAVKAIRHAAEAAKAAGGKGNLGAAAYLYASLLAFQPNDDDRFSLELLKRGGTVVTWTWAGQTDSGAAPGSVEPAGSPPEAGTPRRTDAPKSSTSQGNATIRGLVVLADQNGRLHGKVLEIIGVSGKSALSATPSIKLIGSIGSEMQTSLDEAIRLAKLRDNRAGSLHLEISFDEKYAPKDGGSAGTAFTLLILSSLGQFEPDPAAAITGDITVDGKIRPIGGVRAKITGAALDHMRVVALPTGNADQLREGVLLDDAHLLWNTQIIGIDTIDDAVAVMRKDRAPQLVEALQLFDNLRTTMADRPVGMLASNPQAKATLDRILKLAPNHLSAALLAELAAGKGLTRLPLLGSLEQTVEAMGAIRLGLLRTPLPGNHEIVDMTTIAAMRKAMPRLRKLVDPSVNELLNSIEIFCDAFEKFSAAKASHDMQNTRKYRAEFNQKLADMRGEFYKLLDDEKVIDKLVRGQ